jgi:hypothetical protein
VDAALTARAGARPGTRITLSSAWTPFLKYVWPSCAAAGFLVPTLLAFSPGAGRWSGGGPTPFVKAALVVLSVAVAVGIRYLCVPLKKVALDPTGLWVSNYLADAELRWADVRRITVHGDFAGGRTPSVTVEARGRDPFGGRFVFIPAAPQSLDLLRRALPANLPIEWVQR